MGDYSNTIQTVRCTEVPDLPHSTWSNALVVGNEIVLSGMTAHPARQETGEIMPVYEQTLVVLAKIRALVEAAGGELAGIYRLVVYVTDIADKIEVGRARQAFFAAHREAGGAYPCSTLVEVSALVFPELRVEIEAHARLHTSGATV